MQKLIICLILGFVTGAILYEQVIGLRTFIGIIGTVSSSLIIFTTIKTKKIIFPSIVVVSYFFLLLWMFILLFYSKDVGNSIWELVKTVSFLLLFLAVFNTLKNKPHLIDAILIPFVAISITAIGRDLYGFITSGGLIDGRYLIGSFYWHNQMAGFLLFSIPLCLQFFLTVKSLFGKIFFGIGLLIFVFSMILTYSRAGWLSLIASLFLFYILNRKIIHINIRYLLVGIVIFFIFFSIINFSLVANKTLSMFQELRSKTRTVSGNSRITAWETSFRMIKSFPITGVGPGAFGFSYYGFQKKPWLYTSEAHNHFLQVAAENGIPGIFFFLGIFIGAIIPIYKKIHLFSHKKYSILSGVATGLFGSFLHSFVDYDWSTIALFSIFWIFLGIILAVVSDKNIEIEIKGVRKLFYLPCFSFMLITFILLRSDTDYKKSQKLILENKAVISENQIKKAIALNPFDGRYYYVLGYALYDQKKFLPAKKAYQKAISLNPYDFENYYQIGMLEFQEKKYKKAQYWFERAISINPYSRPKLYLSLSKTYLVLGDKKNAENILRAAVYKAFPLNEAFRGFEYIYSSVGLKTDLATVYLGLIALDLESGKKEEAKKLLTIVEKNLDSLNPLLPEFKKML